MKPIPSESKPEPGPSPEGGDWLEVVRKKVAGLRFGSVQITVHDGRVTQVESVEKTRFVASSHEGRGNPPK